MIFFQLGLKQKKTTGKYIIIQKYFWSCFNLWPAAPRFILFLKKNTADPDQIASEKAIWSGSILFFQIGAAGQGHFWIQGHHLNNLVEVH